MSEIAVVILNYNGRDHLNNFLPSVTQFSGEASIYVIDNHSQDDSLEVISHYPQVQVVSLTTNHGFAKGYNLGLKGIEAKYYVILNSDVEVTKDWLVPLKAFMDQNPDYAVCQPKILDQQNRQKFEYAGAAGGFIDYLGYPFCRGRIFDEIENDEGQYNQMLDILWASGACFMIRSNQFWKHHGFDEDFFAHMEEIDLCWRLYSSGLKAICLPSSKVYHLGGGTLLYGSTKKTYLNFRNGLIMILKNLPFIHLLYILPLRLGLDIVAGIRTLSSSQLFAILKAHIHFYLSFFYHFRKRKKTKKINKRLFGDKILVLNYFILRKRKFTDIQ